MSQSFDLLMVRLQARDNDAAEIVFHRFVGQLIALARTQLADCIRGKVDAEDVVQSVFRSFFACQADRQFHLESWDCLWGLLTTMTLRKCGHRIAYHLAARRDVRREHNLNVPHDWEQFGRLLARNPGPAEAAALNDLLEQIMLALDEPDREILVLHLQGHTQEDISARVGRAERTVRRTLERIRKRLYRLCDAFDIP